ncbi:hypothetical protein ACTXT7_008616 [Hymenolepis weldensis]
MLRYNKRNSLNSASELRRLKANRRSARNSDYETHVSKSQLIPTKLSARCHPLPTIFKLMQLSNIKLLGTELCSMQ